jgi:hypothetical protein
MEKVRRRGVRITKKNYRLCLVTKRARNVEEKGNWSISVFGNPFVFKHRQYFEFFISQCRVMGNLLSVHSKECNESHFKMIETFTSCLPVDCWLYIKFYSG